MEMLGVQTEKDLANCLDYRFTVSGTIFVTLKIKEENLNVFTMGEERVNNLCTVAQFLEKKKYGELV